MSIKPESETAFGRPASWLAALPAVVVGAGAFLLAVYGTWLMPARLQPQYVSALEQSRTEYWSLASGNSVSWKIGEVAGELDVIYSRLIGLEGVDADRYWEWAEFLQAHAATVTRKIQNPAASIQRDTRQRLTDQAQQFEAKAREIVEQLAAGKSHLRATAFLRMARSKYEQGIAEYGVRQPQEIVNELRSLLELSSPTTSAGQSTTGAAGALHGGELHTARLLLIQLMLEAAWHSTDQSHLTADVPLLHAAWEQYQAYRPVAASDDRDVQWQSLGRLLSAMTGEAWPANQGTESQGPEHQALAAQVASVDPSNLDQTVADDSGSAAWQHDLAELQLAAVQADWTQVNFLLSRNAEGRSPEVTTHFARTICRLACSPLAHVPNAWAEQAELGLLLVVQLAPHLPESSELLWECSRQQAGLNNSTVALSPMIPTAVVRGQSAALKHSISALSSAQVGEPGVARTHLQLIQRAHAGLALVARTALWRAQTLNHLGAESATATVDAQQQQELASLIALLTAITELEPDSGLNWFTLGTLQFRHQQFEPMRSSLEHASQLLGKVPAIDQMLDAAGR